MMRSRALSQAFPALLLSGALVFASPVAAQYADQTVALSGGPIMPRASLSDSLKSGFHVTGGLGFHFGDHLTVRAEAMYQQFERKVTATPRNLQMLAFTGDLEIVPLGLSGPYLVGGYGYYRTLKSGDIPASKLEPGINYGAGLRWFTKKFTIFGEARVHQVQGSGKPGSMPIAVGIRV
jgi:hypothetical protein